MKKNNIPHLRVPLDKHPHLAEKLEREAAKRGLSKAAYVRMLIEQGLK